MNYAPLATCDVPYRVHLGRDNPKGLTHWHSEMELIINLRGEMNVTMEDTVYNLKPGDMLLLPGYVTHTARTTDKDSWRVAIIFGYNLLKKHYSLIQNIHLFLPASKADLNPALRAPLDALKRFFENSVYVPEEADWYVRGNLFLLCDYLRSIAQEQAPVKDPYNRIQRLQNIYCVLEYVERNYSQNITVEQMAELTGYSKPYFCRQFKQVTGVSFYRYLTSYRISIACTLLRSPKESISHVAELTGFSTSALFCRTFKVITGMTPSSYRSLPQEQADCCTGAILFATPNKNPAGLPHSQDVPLDQ